MAGIHTLNNLACFLFLSKAPLVTKEFDGNITGRSIGITNLYTDIRAAMSTTNYSRTLGKKRDEMTNHLGNVLATISDRKLPVDDNADNTIDYYTADAITAQMYYAFGAPLEGKTWTVTGGDEYRYGFNGKEDDKETDFQDFNMRLYSPKLGKFIKVDPLSSDFPWNSPYAYAENTPIWAKDIEGLEAWYATECWNNYKGLFPHTNVNPLIKRTCEDLAIGLIMYFARINSLPLELKKEGSTYSNKDTKYHSLNQFKLDVMKNFGANDLRNSGIFSSVGRTMNTNERLSIKEGNILFSYRGENEAHHVQIVTSTGVVDQKLLDEWRSSGKSESWISNFHIGDQFARIVQGNATEDKKWKPFEGDPSSYFYAGKPIETAYYNLTTDTYSREYGWQDSTPNFSNSEKQEITELKGNGPGCE